MYVEQLQREGLLLMITMYSILLILSKDLDSDSYVKSM